MTERVTYRVVHDAHGSWNVEQEDPKRVVSSHKTRIEAILQGRERARSHEYSLLVVHDRDGHIDRQYSYGQLPRNTPVGHPGEPSEVNS